MSVQVQHSIKSEQIVTDLGFDQTYTRRRINGPWVRINVLSIHLAAPQAESGGPKAKGGDGAAEASPRSERPKAAKHGQSLVSDVLPVVSLTSEFTERDGRANSERHIRVTWKAKTPDRVFVAESFVMKAKDADLTLTNENSEGHFILSREFDPAAILAAMNLKDDTAAIKFLCEYLPAEFLLTV